MFLEVKVHDSQCGVTPQNKKQTKRNNNRSLITNVRRKFRRDFLNFFMKIGKERVGPRSQIVRYGAWTRGNSAIK